MSGTFRRDTLTGLVMLLSLAGLILTLWLFGDIRNFWESYYSFTLRLNEAGGLSSTSPVALNGLKIGSILDAKIRDNPADGVEFTIRVKQHTQIPEDFTVYIDKSFVGETTLSLEIPRRQPGASPTTFVQPGTSYERTARTLMSVITEQVKEPLDRVGGMAEDVHRLADVYEKIGQSAAALLEPRTPEQVRAGASPNVASVVARFDAALENANMWLGNDLARSDFAAMLKHGASATEKLDHTMDSFRKVADDAGTSIADLSRRIGVVTDESNAVLRKLGSAADQVGEVAAAINHGDGTLGQLARNPDLYNNARDAASRLEKAVAEFQLLLEKYRKEGLKLQF